MIKTGRIVYKEEEEEDDDEVNYIYINLHYRPLKIPVCRFLVIYVYVLKVENTFIRHAIEAETRKFRESPFI